MVAGEGDAFCAGLDFGLGAAAAGRRSRPAFVPRPWRGTNTFQEACWAWRRLPVPVVAAVHGHCLGGGLQIALAADFRFATPDSRWSVLEGKWGIIPDMSGVRSLAQLVGIDTAKRLTMTAETLSGTEAHELGLVTGLADDPLAAAARPGRAAAGPLARPARGREAALRRHLDRQRRGVPSPASAIEQARLLVARNTKVAREAAAREAAAGLRPPGSMSTRTDEVRAHAGPARRRPALRSRSGPWVLLVALAALRRPPGPVVAAARPGGSRVALVAALAAVVGLVVVVPDGWLPVPPGPGALVTPGYVGRPAFGARPVRVADSRARRAQLHARRPRTRSSRRPLGESPRVDTAWFGRGAVRPRRP